MHFKVATWNMAHWTHKGLTGRAWDYLEKTVHPDFALLQECVPPKHRQANANSCVWTKIGGRRNWGSAVCSRDIPLKGLTLKRNDHPGALTVATVTLPDKKDLVLVSMYGQLDELGYSITTLHRMLSDLTHLFNGELAPGGRPRVILGGDLNASVQLDPIQRNQSHRIFFDRLHDFGLEDCQGAFTSDRPRTLRHSKSSKPWVNDYLFASSSLAGRVISAEVIESPEVCKLSDHNPVVVTFQLK